MHKKDKKNTSLVDTRPASASQIGLSPWAGRLFLGGTVLILLGICDVAARIYSGLISGEIGLFLRMDNDIESLLAAIAILLGGGLLLDYCERLYP